MIRKNIDSIYAMMDPYSTDRDVCQNVVNLLCSLAGVPFSMKNRSFAISVLKQLLQISTVLPRFFDNEGDSEIYTQFY